MVVVEFSITPVVSDALRPYVDAAIDVVKASGLKYEVDAMGTTVEGDLDKVLEVVKNAHLAVKSKGANRVLTEIRVDDKAPGVTIEEEVEAYRQSV